MSEKKEPKTQKNPPNESTHPLYDRLSKKLIKTLTRYGIPFYKNGERMN
jgi:hypothetical protein